MKSEEELQNILTNGINKVFGGKYFINSRMQDVIDKVLESEERQYQDIEVQLSSAILPSMSSCTGSLFEKVISIVAIESGWIDIAASSLFTDTKKGRKLALEIPVLQMKKINEIINNLVSRIEQFKSDTYRNCAIFDKMIDAAKYELKKTCLDIKYDNEKNKEIYECSFDFCMLSPAWLGEQFILVQELKYGGNIDLKKSKAERRSLLMEFAFMNMLYADRIRSGELSVQSRFGIINENKVQSPSVKKYFTDDEVKCGSQFWLSMYGYDLYKFSKIAMRNFRSNESISPEAIEFMNHVKIEIKNKFNEFGIEYKSSQERELAKQAECDRALEEIKLLKVQIELQNKVNNLKIDFLTEHRLETI